MTSFEFKEEIGELPYAAACVGSCTFSVFDESGLDSVHLFNKMWDTMTASEQLQCNRYMELMVKDRCKRPQVFACTPDESAGLAEY